MKKFTIPCDFGEVKAPFNIYVGEPLGKTHPLKHQSAWLSRERGGTVPSEVMDSFQKLLEIARENNVSFEELCVYALGTSSGESAPNPMDSTGSTQSGTDSTSTTETPSDDSSAPEE